jgi:hypothetical protein
VRCGVVRGEGKWGSGLGYLVLQVVGAVERIVAGLKLLLHLAQDLLLPAFMGRNYMVASCLAHHSRLSTVAVRRSMPAPRNY